MNNRIIAFVLTLFVSAAMFAEERQDSVEKRFEVFSAEEVGGINTGKISEYASVSLGAKISRLSVMATYEFQTMKTDEKRYLEGQALGGALSYRLFRIRDLGFPVNGSLTAGFTHSIGNSDWSFSKYKAGITLKQNASTWLNGYFTIGYAYLKSHSANIHDFKGIYAGLGIGF